MRGCRLAIALRSAGHSSPPAPSSPAASRRVCRPFARPLHHRPESAIGYRWRCCAGSQPLWLCVCPDPLLLLPLHVPARLA